MFSFYLFLSLSHFLIKNHPKPTLELSAFALTIILFYLYLKAKTFRNNIYLFINEGETNNKLKENKRHWPGKNLYVLSLFTDKDMSSDLKVKTFNAVKHMPKMESADKTSYKDYNPKGEIDKMPFSDLNPKREIDKIPFEDYNPKMEMDKRPCIDFNPNSESAEEAVYTAYKRVDRKIRPVPGTFPGSAKVTRKFPEDPMKSLIKLPTRPPDFIPGKRLTQDCLSEIKINEGFLTNEEEKLFNFILRTHEEALAFEDYQRGTLREDYFSPYIIPTIDHEPWSFKNIPIPPGILGDVIQLLKEKIDAGVYESSQGSYRSKWFCVLKKNKKLRIVHDLQPLNAITIRDAGLPPNLDQFIEPFAGRQCYTVFDLFWGFDARKMAVECRDMTAFLSPLGLLRLTSLPTGFTNSPAEFQACMVFLLQDEIPHVANIFIDDLPIKGPSTQYLDENGNPETLSDNPGIRRFIWEHANDVHQIMHRIQHAGATFSPNNIQLCRPKVLIVGQKCTPLGRLPDEAKIQKIRDWPILETVKDVRGFLGLCGTVRIWIKDYSKLARPLTELVRKDIDFIWNERRQEAFDQLKDAISKAPVLRPIDYESDLPVVLSVDSSKIAVGFILSQLDENGKKRPARYGSLPMNEREANYSQPKLELYGLFRALRHYRLYLIGIKNFHVEVDAKYIKGMLNEPDLQPNATINRWIQGIMLFDFTLKHVPADSHKGPDALSRRNPQPEDYEDFNDEFLDNIALAITTDDPENHVYSTRKDPELVQLEAFLRTMIMPPFQDERQKKKFLYQVSSYFVKHGQMYRRTASGDPLRVITSPEKRMDLLRQSHDEIGHRGSYAVSAMLRKRFYWPHLHKHVVHYLQSCHECQIRSTRKVELPLTVSTPSRIFLKLYVDVMLMPKAGGYRYIIAARDDLSRASEGKALQRSTSDAIAKFFWEQILCRYGAVGRVVTDNGPEVQGAFTQLMNRYGIPQIRISPYNSKANGVVERGHFIIRESIVKSCKSKINKWPTKVHAAFFADKITINQSTRYSPYYLLHGWIQHYLLICLNSHSL